MQATTELVLKFWYPDSRDRIMHQCIAVLRHAISDTDIDTIFNVSIDSIHHVSQCIAIIGCINLNNITYIFNPLTRI